MSKWEDFIDGTLTKVEGDLCAYVEPDGMWHVWHTPEPTKTIRVREGKAATQALGLFDAQQALNELSVSQP